MVTRQFGPYTIHGELARGGQGAIFRATDASGRPCALKTLTQPDAQSAARFRQEGRVLAALCHPNLLRVTDLGELEGTAFLAMEYVQGEDLSQVIARGVPPFAWSARVLCAIAHALHTCHQTGLIHRDIKPANILVEAATERPVLVDFGLVKRDAEQMQLSSQGPLSKTGEIRGTPKFMSPEQAAPKKYGAVSERSDVYGLGATLYTLLTGSAPFDGESMAQVLFKVVRKPAQAPRKLNPQVPAPLSAFCMGCLEKDPQRRPQSAEAFATELARLTGQSAWLPRFPSQEALPPSAGAPLGKKDPATLGPYKILGLLGRGGMGSVYLGEHRVLGVTRAIKVLGAQQGPDRLLRFARELSHLARVRHPNVVSIHDSGHEGRWVWFAMDLAPGEDLEKLLAREERLPWRRACRLLLGIAQGLGALHAVGVVHRDLKPANIIIRNDGRPVVLDLGLAVAPELDDRMTKTGAIVGTPYYMAPEQLGRAPESPATDVYALGLLFYEALTGQRAVDADSIHQILACVLNEKVPAPSKLAPDVPAEVDAICARALRKAADERYPDARAFAAALVPLCEGEASSRRKPRWSVIVAGLAAAAACVAFALAPRDTAPEPAAALAPVDADADADDLDREPPKPLAPRLSEQELSDGERGYRRLKRVETRAERVPVAVAWLNTHPAAHPRAAEVQTLLHDDRLYVPAREIHGARYVRWLDGSHFVTWSRLEGDELSLWSMDVSGVLMTKRVETKVRGIRFDGERGTLLISADQVRDVCVTLRGDPAPLPPKPPGFLSPDGRLTAFAEDEDRGPLVLADVDSGQVLWKASIEPLRIPRGFAFSSDGSRVVVTGGATHSIINDAALAATVGVLVFDTQDGSRVRHHRLAGRPNFVSFSGSTFAIGTNGGNAFLFDAVGGEQILEFKQKEKQEAGRPAWSKALSASLAAVRGGALSPDGELLYTVSGNLDADTGEYTVWSTKSGEPLRHVDGLRAFLTFDLSPDGAWAAGSFNSGGALVWKAR